MKNAGANLIPTAFARHAAPRLKAVHSIVPDATVSADAAATATVAKAHAQFILPSAWLCCLTAVTSMVMVWQLDLAKEPIRLAYVSAALVIFPVALVVWGSWLLARLALAKETNPGGAVIREVRERTSLAVLPLLIFPLFMAAFTINKTAIPFLVGFGWDRTLMHADRSILGVDAWQITHRFIGVRGTEFLEFFYTIAWGVILALVVPLVALTARPRMVGRFFLAMILTWIIGGLLVAGLFASAGPAFTELVDPTLARHFAPLKASLNALLRPDSLIRETQTYLTALAHERYVIRGGGISAMPSMHIAVTALYVYAARRTPLFVPAILFCGTIMIGSVHFGYHYLVDVIAAIVIAGLCWAAAGAWFDRNEVRGNHSMFGSCSRGNGGPNL